MKKLSQNEPFDEDVYEGGAELEFDQRADYEDWLSQWWRYIADYSDGGIDYGDVMRYEL